MKKVAVSIHTDDEFNPSLLNGLEGYDYVHLDVMDGIFVEPKKLNFEIFRQIKEKTNKPIIAHLMVQHPREYIDKIIDYIDVFLFHLEAEGNKPQIITQVKNNSKKVGIAINPETKVSEVKEYFDKVDVVLVMSVHPGWSGQSFIPETLEKVNELATYKKDFDFLIDVDGGVNLENAKQLKRADILSSSSTILKADSPNRIIQLLKTSDEHD
ncbi:MAG: ribulose-phosphate 3-epimerase [Promethearchaeia archaeon]